MDASHGSARPHVRGALLALVCALALGAAGCSSAPQEPQKAAPAPAPADSVAAANDDEAEAAAAAPVAPAVSYQDNAKLVFEDIPANRVVSLDDLSAMIDGDEVVKLIDIRSWAAYDEEHIAESTSIPAGQQVVLRIDEVSKKIPLVLIAQNNDRLAETRQTLIDLGIPEEHILVLDGGIDAWKEAGYPLATHLEGEVHRC